MAQVFILEPETIAGVSYRPGGVYDVSEALAARLIAAGHACFNNYNTAAPSPTYRNRPNVDAFQRLRVANPQGLFDGQFTYNLLPLQFEAITAQSGATVTHDATNRCAAMAFSSTPTGGKAYLQSYEYIRYQPGRSQNAFITFNFIEGAASVVKFARYGDATNGIEFQLSGASTLQFVLNSGTANGNQTATQTNWNIDRMDGTGVSGETIDPTKIQILVIDLQALYAGRVRLGFDIDGKLCYAHEFNHANLIAVPYIQNASLPIACGMTCTGTVTTTMRFICSAVISDGGQEETGGLTCGIGSGTVSAASGADTHFLSVRPKTTFNSITNRVKFIPESVDIVVSGNAPVQWKLVVGQAITGTTTFADVNTNTSAFEYNTAGTISGTAYHVLAQGYASASNQAKGAANSKIANRFPITLDAAGAVRANGTISIIAQGVGAGSNMNATLNWRELR